MPNGYQHSHSYATRPERIPVAQEPHMNNAAPSRPRRRYGRQQSSGSMTSTSRDFSTNRNRGPDQTYPQPELTRKSKDPNLESRKDKYSSHHKRTSGSKSTEKIIRPVNPQESDVQKNVNVLYSEHLKHFQFKDDLRKKDDLERNYSESYKFNSVPQRNGISENRQWPMQKFQKFSHPGKSLNPSNMYYKPMVQQYNYNKSNVENMYQRDDHKDQQSLLHPNTDSQIPRSILEEIIGLSAVDCISPVHRFPGNQPVNPYFLPLRNDERSLLPGAPCFTQFQQNCLTALASMLLCPHTVVPILVGLFSRPGSPADYIQQLGVYLKQSSPYYYDQNRIGFKWRSAILPLIMSVLLGYILGLALGWQLGVAVVVTATVLYGIFFCFIVFGVKVKQWTRSIEMAETLSRYMRGCNLLFNILFYRPPKAPTIAKPVRLLPISLNLSSCSSSMDAIVQLTEKIWLSIEQKYGKTAVRLQWASEDIYGETATSFRKLCCLPLWIWLLLNLTSILTMGTLLAIRQNLLHDITDQSSSTDHKDSTSKSEDDETQTCIHVLKQIAIVCGVLSGLSSLMLGVAMLPAIMKLVRGRPLQHPKQRIFPADGESITDTTMDSCYGAGAKRFYPGACFDPAGGGPQTMMTCFPHGPYYTNGPNFPFRPDQDLTSAATVAAAAAAAAVTAADHQWRIIGSQKYERQTNNKKQNIKHRRSDLLESGSPASSADDSKLDQSSEEDSASESENPNIELEEDQLQTETALFNSDELLLNKQGRKPKFLKTKRFLDKEKTGSKQTQSASTARKEKLAEYKKSIQIIQQHVLEACLVLSILDNRIGDRQTRIIVCINGILSVPGSNVSLSKLTTFMRLIDQVLMKTPSGGRSSEVSVILTPMENPASESPAMEANWSPNVITLLTATVPETWHPDSHSKLDLVNSFQQKSFNDIKSTDPSRGAVANSYLTSATNFKSWWSIHHLCHLPIYLEDEPPGFNISSSSSGPLFTSPTHSSSTIRYGHSTAVAPNKPIPTNLPDLFIGNHGLADLNEKRFRHLLTLTSFIGRLIKLDRLYAHQVLHMSNQKHLAYMHALQYFANEPNLNTITTWLCLIQHWPFHAAWLALFIERNYSQSKKDNHSSNLLSGHNSRSEPESLNRTPKESVQKESYQPNSIQLSSNLSTLHSRVLRRLAQAIEAARLKALSASMSTMLPGVDNQQTAHFSSTINSTLQICELAQKDRDPNRLAEFLRSTPSQIDRPELISFSNDAGKVSVDQLIRVMKLSPFLNPQINKWIKEVLLPKLSVMEHIDGRQKRRAVSSHSNRRSQPSTSGRIIRRSSSQNPADLINSNVAQPYLTSLRLHDLIPQKPLKQLTVDDVCQLAHRIVQLTNRPEIHDTQTTHHLVNERDQSSEDTETLINDVMPPAAISTNSNRLRSLRTSQSSLGKIYEDRITQLNITGTVLSMCPLDELQKELGLTPSDWKIFSAIVKYLKKVGAESVKRVGSIQQTKQMSNNNLKSDSRDLHTRSTVSKEILNGRQESLDLDRKLMNTISDTSLTIKSAPLSKDTSSIPKNYPQSRTPSTKSMNALGNSNVYVEDATTQTGRSTRPAHIKTHQPTLNQTYGTAMSNFTLCANHQKKKLGSIQGQNNGNILSSKTGHTVPVLCTVHQAETGGEFIDTRKPNCEFAQITKSHVELRTMDPSYGINVSDNKRRSQQRNSKMQHMDAECSDKHKELDENEQPYRTQTLPNSFENYRSRQFTAEEFGPNVFYCERHRLANSGEAKPSCSASNYGKIEGASSLTVNWPSSTQHKLDMNKQTEYKASTSHVNPHTAGHAQCDETIPTHFIKKEPKKEDEQYPFYPSVELPKDSASTSIAGELGEEVVDASISSGDHEDLINTGEHPCDCNYWYSREQEIAIDPHESIDIERSSLETLSTSTQSQLDVSSGASSDQCSTDTNN